MAMIEKKIWPKYFELVKSGKKRFELRLTDFKVKKGDILVLKEWDPKKKEYTGRKVKKMVNFVLKFKLNDFGQKKEIDRILKPFGISWKKSLTCMFINRNPKIARRKGMGYNKTKVGEIKMLKI